MPAAWLVGALCVLAHGLLPRACMAISWTVWFATVALGQIAGPLYGVWGGTPFEPFHHIPNTVTGHPFDPVPPLVLTTLSALLSAGGLLALSRRDIG
ncbi:hypothetical protein [Goodfellowiella coeruleoviolacea]|uniref:Uncharacterized protein n=1 Tax=Goodfellowiella coeruleoviolacea TaxID=334858 RepID=A0AAE3GM38_9PSEU|nr:hypothetical protein [Goodfellowiella coeruleoviolacea]MCP2169809.1 hypothetical protein [Goodfellowiella coeruleoviolacea]